MKIAMFQTPFMGPERSEREVFEWAVRQAIVADQAGFSEYWIGEHATLPWEGIPSPELIIAAAALQTEQIKLGPLAHLLPYHHPATLAVQTSWLSHVLKGRYMLGVATGAYPSDAELRGFSDMSKHHRMMLESIDIMERVWRGEPFAFQGEFWNAGLPQSSADHQLRDVRPYGGTIPIAMTGLSPDSPSIKFAAAHGYIPTSIYAGNEFLRNHFEIFEQTSAAHGRPGGRETHHVVRDIVVADTDAEARRIAIEGGLGNAWKQYLLPTYHTFGVLSGLLHDKAVDLADVDLDYLADHVWIVGSPETVKEKMQKWCEEIGGSFGTLVMYSHDYSDDPAPWEESMQRLAKEIMPEVGA